MNHRTTSTRQTLRTSLTSLSAWPRLAVVLWLVTAGAPLAAAHPVTVDGDPTDWTGAAGPVVNCAQIARDAAGGGEYVWRDAAGDTRPEVAGNPGLDLLQLRLTGDGTRLYLYARLRGTPVMAGAGAPLLQVAMGHAPGAAGGATAFAGGAATAVPPTNAWDALFATRFASRSAPVVMAPDGTPMALSAEAVLASGGVIEASIPWAALGQSGPPGTPVRFSVALFRSTADDHVDVVAAGASSQAVDVVSDAGAPGTTPGTAAVMAGGSLDYAFDVWFDAAGEVTAPLEITQVYYGQGPSKQWLEVANAGRSPLRLAGYKLGDAARPGDSRGGMGTLPDVSLRPGQTFVVAQDALAFESEYAMWPGAECQDTDPRIPELGLFPAWSATPSLDMIQSGDQVLLLDAANTIVDAVVWKGGVWPGLTPSPGAIGNGSLVRSTLGQDTDNCGVDFLMDSKPAPASTQGVLGVGTAVPTSFQFRLAPNPFRGAATVTVRFASAGAVRARVEVLDVTGRRVRTLTDGTVTGATTLAWAGEDEGGRMMPSGVYLFRVTSPAGSQTVRGMLLR